MFGSGIVCGKVPVRRKVKIVYAVALLVVRAYDDSLVVFSTKLSLPIIQVSATLIT